MTERTSQKIPPLPNRTERKEHVKTISVILNGISFKKEFFYKKILPALQSVAEVTVYETRTKHDAVTLASKIVEKRMEVILAAGGDGTLNQVVNGMLAGNETNSKLPVLGLIPLGSGNDFAKTMNLTSTANAVKEVLTRFHTKPTDIGKITFLSNPELPPRYFINIADVGMGPIVVERVLNSDRVFGSWMAYYTAIIHTFFTYRPEAVKVQTPLWKWEGAVRSLAVANGKFFGNGLGIAPDAEVDDGKFSCFIAGKVSVLDFILQSERLRKGKRAIHDEIEYREANEITLTASKLLPVEADGELVGNLPVRIELLPKQLKFLC